MVTHTYTATIGARSMFRNSLNEMKFNVEGADYFEKKYLLSSEFTVKAPAWVHDNIVRAIKKLMNV